MSSRRVVEVLIPAILFGSGLMRAQTSGSLEGTVKNNDGKPLSATAEIRDRATGKTWTHQTDKDGLFVEPILAPAVYELRVRSEPYPDYRQANIPVAVGQRVRLNVVMALPEETTVIASNNATAHLDLSTGAISVAVGNAEMRDLPLNGRSFEQLALLQPGITAAYSAGSSFYGARTRAISINGARPEQNSFLLDGGDIMNAYNKTPGTAVGILLGVDGVLEYQVLTNAYSPEFGRAAGGVINAATLHGSNAPHASLFYFLRNSAVDAKNYFNAPGQKIPGFKRNQFGGVAAGRIKKDRAFFSVSMEDQIERLGIPGFTAVPNANARLGIFPAGNVMVSPAIKPYLEALFPLPNGRSLGGGVGLYDYSLSQPASDQFYQVRGDYRSSEKSYFFARYTLSDGFVNRVPAGTLPVAILDERTRNQYLSAQLTRTLTPSLFDIVTAGFSRSAAAAVNRRTVANIDALSFLSGSPFGYITITGLTNSIGGDARIPRRDYLNNYQLANSLLWLHGRHTVKGGFSGERQQFNAYNTIQQGGAVVFSNLLTFLQAKASSIDFSIPNAYDPVRGFRQSLVGGFATDEFRILEQLTLNYGVRWEFATVPVEVNGKMANLRNISDSSLTVGDPYFHNPAGRNFAPRIGFAWDPRHGGKTVLRGGFGLFHDLVLPRSYFIVATRNPPFSNRILLNNPHFPMLAQDLANLDSVPRSVNSFATDFENPYASQFNLTINHAWKQWELNGAYVGSRGLHLTRQAETNLAPFVIVNGVKTYQPILGRQNPNFASIVRVELDARSFYNAFQFMAVRRFSNGFRTQVSYTRSKSVDDTSGIVSSDFINTVQYTMDYLARTLDRGLSSFHAAQVLVANASWELPWAKQARGWRGALFGGWQLHNISTVQSGHPFTIQMGYNSSGNLNTASLTANERPDVNPGFQGNAILGDPRHYWDVTYVRSPAPNQRGNLGRNTLIGPGLLTIDGAAAKHFRFGDTHDLQFRAEMFNVTNTPNFATPSGRTAFTNASGAVAATQGQISSTVTSSRQIQLALRMAW